MALTFSWAKKRAKNALKKIVKGFLREDTTFKGKKALNVPRKCSFEELNKESINGKLKNIQKV